MKKLLFIIILICIFSSAFIFTVHTTNKTKLVTTKPANKSNTPLTVTPEPATKNVTAPDINDQLKTITLNSTDTGACFLLAQEKALLENGKYSPSDFFSVPQADNQGSILFDKHLLINLDIIYMLNDGSIYVFSFSPNQLINVDSIKFSGKTASAIDTKDKTNFQVDGSKLSDNYAEQIGNIMTASPNVVGYFKPLPGN